MSNMDVGCNLQWSTSSTMTSRHHFHSTVTQSCQNMSQLCQCNCVKMNLYAYIPIAKTLNMSSMDVRSNQRWSTASTMTSWHQFHLTVTHNCQHLPQCCPCDSGNETLYICPIWMWEAICSGLQPQPWHHDIISNEQSPWIANIWCWKSQKLGS